LSAAATQADAAADEPELAAAGCAAMAVVPLPLFVPELQAAMDTTVQTPHRVAATRLR
jgi:hypothetical protein